MRLKHFAATVLIAFVADSCATTSQPSGDRVVVACADFRRNQDGSWVVVRPTRIDGPRGPFSAQPGQKFVMQIEGTTNYGVNVAEVLDQKCQR